MQGDLVTVITPVYNSEKFIKETMLSVLCQTHADWEMILVDDCSTDRSAEMIAELAKDDARFRYYKLIKNSGAAAARNFALDKANGRFIAYLDADDTWRENKLEKQIRFMLENNIQFCCTDYEVIDEAGSATNKIIHIPKIVSYNLFLRNTIIQTVGVIVDRKITGSELLQMTLARKEGASSREDAATWCNLLKNGYPCHALSENLACYRRVTGSLSSNKIKSARGTWHLYREIEELPLWKACYCFVGYAFNAIRKRVHFGSYRMAA